MDSVSKPITDISSRAVSLAREIDRLPPGEYTLHLVKPADKAQPLHSSVQSASVQIENRVTVANPSAV